MILHLSANFLWLINNINLFLLNLLKSQIKIQEVNFAIRCKKFIINVSKNKDNNFKIVIK